LVAGGTCLLLKNVITAARPDMTNYNSFPSGHTVLGFVGAELVRMNYGWAWGLGAYTVASVVAFMRVYQGRHWMSDILFGAGLGILGAHVGEWLLEPTKRFFNIGPLTVVPTMDPLSGTVCASLAFAF
jgi:membrane-associated phospholipid phosphatase